MSSAATLPRWAFAAISLLFGASGATGLAYEIVWFRRFGEVWGHSSLSIAAVVGSFLLGLGLGARFFGSLADSSTNPLRLYALFEVGIALSALLVPVAAQALAPLASALYGALGDAPVLLACARFAVTACVLAPPTILMGGTLPLLVRCLGSPDRRSGSVARATSWLYFLNSAGAALGAWATGFFVLPALGLSGTNTAVIAANLAIAGLAWIVARQLPPTPVERIERTADNQRVPTGVLWAALVSGCAAIGLQIVWTRQVVLAIGGSTYAFTSVLTVFVLGIALGSLAYRALERSAARATSILGVVAFLLTLSVALGQFLRPDWTQLIASWSHLRSSPLQNALVCAGASAALLFVPALCMGLFFPALVRASGAERSHAGRAVGRLYAWNTAGSIFGATLTSALFFQVLGTFGTACALSAAYALAVLLAVAPSTVPRGRLGPAAAAAAALVSVVGFLAARPDEQTTVALNAGAFLYGNAAVDMVAKNSRVLAFAEGSTSNVIVLELEAPDVSLDEPLVAVRVNGKVDGSTIASDMQTQLGCAYVPLFLRPGARDVLVVGFGTGTSVGASLLFPETRVVCCEIEPAVLATSEHFRDANHAPLESPRLQTVVEDGRNFLQSTDDVFDIVISVPSNPWIAGIASLFTAEYYESTGARLAPGGLLAQWIQAYQLGPDEIALVVNTLQQSFEHTALVRFNAADLLLLASDEPIVPNRAAIDYAQAIVNSDQRIALDLERHYRTSDVRALLLRLLLLDGAGLQRFVDETGDPGLNTDSNLKLEFAAPLRLFEALAGASQDPAARLLAASSPEAQASWITQWGWTELQLASLYELRGEYAELGQMERAMHVSRIAVSAATDPPAELLVDRFLSDPADPNEERRRIEELVRRSREWAERLRTILLQAGDEERAAWVSTALAGY